MSLLQPDVDTSHSEVTNIGSLGFWLVVDNQEYFVPFADHPTFDGATVAQIYSIIQSSLDQFQWLDLDMELAALAHPERFPLQFHE